MYRHVIVRCSDAQPHEENLVSSHRINMAGWLHSGTRYASTSKYAKAEYIACKFCKPRISRKRDKEQKDYLSRLSFCKRVLSDILFRDGNKWREFFLAFTQGRHGTRSGIGDTDKCMIEDRRNKLTRTDNQLVKLRNGRAGKNTAVGP